MVDIEPSGSAERVHLGKRKHGDVEGGLEAAQARNDAEKSKRPKSEGLSTTSNAGPSGNRSTGSLDLENTEGALFYPAFQLLVSGIERSIKEAVILAFKEGLRCSGSVLLMPVGRSTDSFLKAKTTTLEIDL
ncbi:hypothetical protein SCHPADRAFT_911655 [Schizopora paradoxa]|nr:hypothetical protein SCHPADRAFT_911655 [Schizopora paradoxa]